MLKAENKKFFLDGEEFQIRSGAFHYFRALPEYWEDILTKFKVVGFNTVETYVCWNLHEPQKGVFDFSGRIDLEKFISLADKVGLKVILRVGPFICAEWDNGGFPAWLLNEEKIKFRCVNETYLKHVKEWFNVLLPKIKPLLDSNGGPVIAMAVENEYGSFGDDREYLEEIEKMYKENGIDCLYIAADGGDEYFTSTSRSNNNVVQCSDFGVGTAKRDITAIDRIEPNSPRMAAEYWAGNFTCWGMKENYKVKDDMVKQDMEDMLALGASFNIYMMYGGTNFGFMSGSKANSGSWDCFITSYDYDAAITEWGGYTRRYFDMKECIEKKTGKVIDTPLPDSPDLQNIGKVKLNENAPLFENLHIGKNFISKTIENMESFGQSYGYILYRKVFDYEIPLHEEFNIKECRLKIAGLRDRALVYFNGELAAIRMRIDDESDIVLPRPIEKGDVLEILVENMGRNNFGPETYLGDRKGILGGVFFYEKCLFDWEVITLELEDINAVNYSGNVKENTPAFYRGCFETKRKDGCFVHLDNFKKGVVFVNGFNLGRYWERGPQTALYLPGALLKEKNEIVVFETDGLKGEPFITLNDKHGLGDKNEVVIVKNGKICCN